MVVVPSGALSWMERVEHDGGTDVDPVAAALTLTLIARRIPAWTEVPRRLLDRVATVAPDNALVTRARTQLRNAAQTALTPPLPDISDRRPIDSVGLFGSASPSRLAPGVLTGDGTAIRAAFDAWVEARPPDRTHRPSETDRIEVAAAALWAREWDRRELSDAFVSSLDGFDLSAAAQAWLVAASLVDQPGVVTRALNEPWTPCPQVVDVEYPALTLRRAEWVRGCLLLGLMPQRDDPQRRTTFRIVGAEPRVWCFSGLDGARLDCTSQAQIVTVPMRRADVEFAEGSY
jgi:hypothetical protein